MADRLPSRVEAVVACFYSTGQCSWACAGMDFSAGKLWPGLGGYVSAKKRMVHKSLKLLHVHPRMLIHEESFGRAVLSYI